LVKQGMDCSCRPSCDSDRTASTSTAMKPMNRRISMLTGTICRRSSGCSRSGWHGISASQRRNYGGCRNWLRDLQRDSWRTGMGILALAADERVTGVKFTKDALSVSLRDGRTITVPLAWFPRLLNASAAQRKNWRVAGGGYGIHWPDLDEDLSTEGLL